MKACEFTLLSSSSSATIIIINDDDDRYALSLISFY